MKTAGILILDLGDDAESADTRQIAARLKALGFYAEIHPWRRNLDALDGLQVRGLILAGGETPDGSLCSARPPREAYEQSVPVLGIDQGMLIMATQFRGTLTQKEDHTADTTDVGILRQTPLFETLVDAGRFDVLLPGRPPVDRPPTGFVITATARGGEIAAMENLRRGLFALRFHPQSPETSHGFQILSNFALNVCQLDGTWCAEEET